MSADSKKKTTLLLEAHQSQALPVLNSACLILLALPLLVYVQQVCKQCYVMRSHSLVLCDALTQSCREKLPHHIHCQCNVRARKPMHDVARYLLLSTSRWSIRMMPDSALQCHRGPGQDAAECAINLYSGDKPLSNCYSGCAACWKLYLHQHPCKVSSLSVMCLEDYATLSPTASPPALKQVNVASFVHLQDEFNVRQLIKLRRHADECATARRSCCHRCKRADYCSLTN